ncbi:MAG: hypothetical protein EBT07_15790 [Actinobacteria bacterium]|nr:hypothetical protein [Actinomycetota bacterium]
MTQAQFAQQIGISTMMLKLIEQCRRPLTDRVKDAIHLVTGIDPLSWNKKKLQSTLGHPFDRKTYDLWQMVRQNENEDAPKRVFILKTVQRYNLAKPLACLKRELEQRGEKWPEEAFAAPKAPAYKASIATALLKADI